MIRVLVDACLLVKGNVSNALFDLAQAGLISLHWTPQIASQFIKNWAARRVSDENQLRKRTCLPLLTASETTALKATAQSNARSRLTKFELMAPQWRIPGWDAGLVSAAYPKISLGVGARGGHGVHLGDYDVALAAIRLAEIFFADEIWLATENIHHLPPAVMKQFDVWSLHPGLLLETLYAQSPDQVQTSLEQTLADTRRPTLEKIDMLAILASSQEFASPLLRDKLAQAWGIAMRTEKQTPARAKASIKKTGK